MIDAPATHAYRVFDLNVVSCLALPARRRAAGEFSADVEIIEGEVPRALPDARHEGLRFQVAAQRVLLVVDGVARFLIEGGRRIVVARDAQADDDDVRAFLLGAAFGALLQQRGDLVLRGCAVARGGAGVLLLGHSGTGKSSIAAALGRRGWAVFADEPCVIRARADGSLAVVPGWTHMKLWPSAIGETADWPAVRRGVEKRVLPLAPADDVLPLGRIYGLRRSPAPGPGIERLTGLRKLSLLNRHVYHAEFLDAAVAQIESQRLAARLAQEVPMALLPRAQNQLEFEAVAELCAADFSA